MCERHVALVTELQALVDKACEDFKDSPLVGWVLIPDLELLYELEDAKALEEMKRRIWEEGRSHGEQNFISCPDDNPYGTAG